MFSFRPKIENYVIVDTLHKLKVLAKKMKYLEEFSYDTETNTLRVFGKNRDFKLVGISISWGEYNNYYIPLGHVREEDYNRQLYLDTVVEYLKPVFEREDVRIIGHNLKFDMHVLARVGIFIRTKDLFDTMIASWLCNENTPNGLKENSLERLGIEQTHFKEVTDTVPMDIRKEFGLKANSRVPFDLVLIEDGALYALDDAFYTWELYLGYLDLLEEEKMHRIYQKVYVPFLITLFKMEERGVTVDTARLDAMKKEIKKDMEDLEYQMFEIAGVEFNPSSSQQLAELLFGYRKPDKEYDPNQLTIKRREYYANRDWKALEKDGFYFEDGKLYAKSKCNENILDVSFNFRVQAETKGGAPSTSGDTLWKLSKLSFKDRRKKEGVDLCNLLMDYKKLDKLNSAFVVGLKEQLYEDGKAHPSFNIIGTDSGRISCSEPNLQQLPKAEEEDKYQIRSLFIGSLYAINKKTNEIIDSPMEIERLSHHSMTDWEIKRKKIVAIDYSNLEVRVNAHFSEDENLLRMFANGDDVHGSTAVNMFELDCPANECKKKYPHLRQVGKVLNFLLIYGGGAYTLYENLKNDHFNPIDLGDKKYLDMYKVKKGEDVAQIYIDKYFSTYVGVAKFIKNQKRFAHKNGFVYTLLRRKRRLENINCGDYKITAYEERLSVNSPIQGSAADIVSSAQIRIDTDPWFEEHGVLMIIQVHDEIVFESPEEYVEEAIERAQRYMSRPFGDNVTLNVELLSEADFGDSYQDAK